MFTSEKMVKFLREKYPPGTRIRLVSMEDPYAPVAPGTEGTLVCVDDAGQFQMKWENGRTLALIPWPGQLHCPAARTQRAEVVYAADCRTLRAG